MYNCFICRAVRVHVKSFLEGGEGPRYRVSRNTGVKSLPGYKMMLRLDKFPWGRGDASYMPPPLHASQILYTYNNSCNIQVSLLSHCMNYVQCGCEAYQIPINLDQFLQNKHK